MTIQELIERCKGEVSLTVNEFKNYYQTVQQGLDDLAECDVLSDEARVRILESGSIVNLHFYPDTPIGFYSIIDSSLEECLKRAEKALETGEDK